MEVIAGWTHRAFAVSDLSCVGEARRHASGLAKACGWSEVDTERAAIVVTELGTNLAKHAHGGQLLIAARDPLQDIEVIAVDQGPGIPDVDRAMRDGFSTRATPGAGLGAIARQSESFEIHSSQGAGTVSVARLRRRKGLAGALAEPAAAPGRRFCFGGVCVPVKGEAVCGDGWAVAFDGPRAAALVADGLGHGPEAALASSAATQHFAQAPFQAPERLLGEAHDALRTTRGAAVFGLWLDADQLRYAGAGNVVGRMISGTSDKSLITPHGTMGLQARRLVATAATLPPHGTVLIHSDGLQSRWPAQALVPLLRKDPVLLAARLYADQSRGRDDVCVLALRPEEAA